MTEHRAGRRWRTLLAWAGFGVLVLCVLAVAAMYLRGGRTSIGVVIAAALPVVVGVALVAALVSWRHLRWWRLALVAALLLSQAPLLDHVVADPRPAAEDGPTITVATLNTAWAGPTDAELVDLADGADVLALQEWDPGRTDGLGRALGPQWRLAASDHDDYIGTDVDVWVRSPWTVASSTPLAGRQPGSALRLRRGGTAVTVVGTRLQNPAFLAADRWGEGLDSLRLAAEGSDGPVIVLGDLNAPPSAVAYRRWVKRTGLRDCTAQLGSGFPGTWGRTRGAAYGPVPIDHVTTRGAACTALEVTRERGSDHRALTATVALP
ncbi:endonuclease/exonuclease/phosphatase family protein [Janibacter anophelis]|uniref:endonuclease/exonuclease/phosphatase family protein n=1 Tax=Janibacter anophelis TaxID=319054 RepID=UPI000DEED191|nr:endonuclease/exonuclease/phosphatase family protein [Janibacter anophelis]